MINVYIDNEILQASKSHSILNKPITPVYRVVVEPIEDYLTSGGEPLQ